MPSIILYFVLSCSVFFEAYLTQSLSLEFILTLMILHEERWNWLCRRRPGGHGGQRVEQKCCFGEEGQMHPGLHL